MKYRSALLMSLGIYDWGTGGLRLYNALRSTRPDLDIVYLADQGSEDYGLLSREALTERVTQVIQAFAAMGISRVIVACDAASTVLNEVSVPGMTVSGLIEPTLNSMRQMKFREVGIIGGRRTILSGAYGRSLRKLRFMVVQRVSLDLTSEIERGDISALTMRESIEALLEPLAKSDALVLADTNYSIVANMIRSVLPNTELIDPVAAAVAELAKELPEFKSSQRSTLFYTTGDPLEMKRRARLLVGLSIEARSLELAEPKLAA